MNEDDLVQMYRACKDPLELALLLLDSNGSGSNSTYPKAFFEASSVSLKILLLHELQKAVEGQLLKPISTLEIAPESQKNIYVIFTPDGSDKPYIQV